MKFTKSVFPLLRAADASVTRQGNYWLSHWGGAYAHGLPTIRSPEFAVLATIAEYGANPPSVEDLARDFGLDRNSVNETVQALERHHFVVRVKKLGVRGKRLSLTPLGRGVWRSRRDAWQQFQNRWRRKLGRRDADALLRILEKVRTIETKRSTED